MLIRLNKIEKLYRVGAETIRALDGVDLAIDRNEFVSVMGASGSGKSTLMNIIGCLDRPTHGVYELTDQRTSTMSAAQLAQVRNQRIGFVFQSFELMPRFSAVSNVALPLTYAKGGWSHRRRRAMEALERVNLGDRASHRPNQLSGGQKQRVAIARALINHPDILLADEPTGNLDSKTTTEILSLFVQLHREGQTIIIVTHEREVAAYTKRIIRMRDGRIDSDLPVEQDAEVAAALKRVNRPAGGEAGS